MLSVVHNYYYLYLYLFIQFENFNMFANIYRCFPPLSMTRGRADDPDFSVDLTRSMAIFHTPEILYVIPRNCYTSQGDPDSSFPLWSSHVCHCNLHVRHLQAWMFHASGIILYMLRIVCYFNLKILFNK